MNKRFYTVTRDLHLYIGLFLAPFVLVFAVSVFFLVHSWLPGVAPEPGPPRTVTGVLIPNGVENLDGRKRVDAVRAVLDPLGVAGEVTVIRHIRNERRLVIPVIVPGRETTVDINLETRTALVSTRTTGIWDALVTLHKAPGPHLVAIRMNWFPMRVWKWLADATVWLVLFLSVSGIYLWAVLRAERRIGLVLIAAGATSFFGVIYALVR
ncbi:MAG TPA: hypothetical protein VLE22_22755 [Bryobacteraceae bacterium]|nr:hypothetical protein [Bryobacteraceae bacterium]